MNKPKFKLTKEMVTERFIKILQEEPEQAKAQAKPNVLEILKSKAGLNRTRNERT